MNLFLPTGLEAFATGHLAKIQKILTFLAIGQAVLGVLLLVGNTSSGFSLIVEGLLLYCTVKSFNVCMCTVYILLAFLELVNGSYYIGMFITAYLYQHDLVHRKDVIPMFKVPLFLLSTFYCFLFYREVKAAFIENGMNAGLIEPPRASSNNSGSNNRAAFEGRGYRLDR
jgi:hypothetical protein